MAISVTSIDGENSLYVTPAHYVQLSPDVSVGLDRWQGFGKNPYTGWQAKAGVTALFRRVYRKFNPYLSADLAGGTVSKTTQASLSRLGFEGGIGAQVDLNDSGTISIPVGIYGEIGGASGSAALANASSLDALKNYRGIGLKSGLNIAAHHFSHGDLQLGLSVSYGLRTYVGEDNSVSKRGGQFGIGFSIGWSPRRKYHSPVPVVTEAPEPTATVTSTMIKPGDPLNINLNFRSNIRGIQVKVGDRIYDLDQSDTDYVNAVVGGRIQITDNDLPTEVKDSYKVGGKIYKLDQTVTDLPNPLLVKENISQDFPNGWKGNITLILRGDGPDPFFLPVNGGEITIASPTGKFPPLGEVRVDMHSIDGEGGIGVFGSDNYRVGCDTVLQASYTDAQSHTQNGLTARLVPLCHNATYSTEKGPYIFVGVGSQVKYGNRQWQVISLDEDQIVFKEIPTEELGSNVMIFPERYMRMAD